MQLRPQRTSAVGDMDATFSSSSPSPSPLSSSVFDWRSCSRLYIFRVRFTISSFDFEMLNKTRFAHVEYVVKMTVIAVAGFSEWRPSGSSLEFPSDRRADRELHGRNPVLSACVVCSPRLVTVEFTDNEAGLGKVVYPVVDEAVDEVRLHHEDDVTVRALGRLGSAARV